MKSAHGFRSRVTRFAAFAVLFVFFALSWGCTEKLPNYPPAYREYAYVTDGKSNEVSVIDTLTFKNVKHIRVGEGPTGIAANPKKNEIYVVNTDSNNLSIIDAERNAVVATIGLHRSPYFVDLTPDSKRAYIANAGSGNVSVVDLDARKTVGIIPVGHSPGLARVSPDGKTAVASNRGDGTVSVIDTATLKVRSTVAVCQTPEEIVFLADSSKAFISCSSANEIAVVQLQRELPAPAGSPAAPPTPKPTSSRSKQKSSRKGAEAPPGDEEPQQNSDRLLTLLDVGKTPMHLALKPDGGEIFVSNFGSDSVSEVLTGNNEVSSTHLLGPGPVRSIVSDDNSLLYVSNFNGNSVSIYAIDDGKLLQAVPVGTRPDALALTPSQQYLLVVDSGSGDVSVVRNDGDVKPPRKSFILFTMVPVGLDPRQIVVKAFMLRKPPEQ